MIDPATSCIVAATGGGHVRDCRAAGALVGHAGHVSALILILVFAASVAWCAERLVRATRPASCVLALPTMLGSWAWLMTLRLPPSPELALVAFTLADLAVLAISVLGVLRLLGGFDRFEDLDDDGDGDSDDERPPMQPDPSAPTGRRPARRAPHPPRSGPRPGSRRPSRGRRVSA